MLYRIYNQQLITITKSIENSLKKSNLRSLVKQQPASPNKVLIPLLLFLVSFFLRVALMSKGPFNIDSLVLTLQAEKTLDTGRLQHLFGSGYPLAVMLASLFIRISDLLFPTDHVLAVNFMSVVFGALSVPAFYGLTRTLFHPLTALYSALLFSLNPLFLGISVYGMSHAPSLFFGLTGLFFIAQWTKHPEQSLRLYTGGFFLGLMGATRLQEMTILLVPVGLLLVARSLRLRPPLSWLVLTGFILCLLLPPLLCHLPYLLGPDQQAYLGQWRQYQQSSLSGRFMPSIIMANLKTLATACSPLGLGISLLGIILLVYRRSPYLPFLCAWIILPLLLYARVQTMSPRFLNILLPPLLIFQGIVLRALTRFGPLWKTTSLATFALLAFLNLQTIYPRLLFRHHRALLIEYAQWIARVTEPTARIIVGDDSLVIRYYGHRASFPKPLRTSNLTDEELVAFQRDLDETLDRGIPVYATFIGLFDYDPGHKFSRFLTANYRLTVIGQHLYEDWHQGEITKRIFYNPLVRIQKKNP